MCASTDWAVNKHEGQWSCLKCYNKYNPGDVNNKDTDCHTAGQKVMAVRQDADTPIFVHEGEEVTRRAIHDTGTGASGDLWHLALCMWPDTITTNMGSRLKAIFHDVLTEFQNKNVSAIKHRLVEINERTIPGIFERRPYGPREVAAFNEEHKWRNDNRRCYVPKHVIDRGWYHGFHYDTVKYPYVMSQDDVIGMYALTRGAILLNDRNQWLRNQGVSTKKDFEELFEC